MKSASFDRLFSRRRPARFIGAHNGLGARLGERAGFDAIWASGLEISASLGVPDANIISSTEVARVAANIAASTALPVMVDMDCGYGEPQQVYFSVREFARAGVHAVCIEDKMFPKSNSFSERAQILQPMTDFAAKLEAAVSALSDQKLWIVARTEAFVAGRGVKEALKRAAAYVEAGADAIVVQSRRSDASEIEAFCRDWRRPEPVIAIPTSYPSVSVRALQDMGVKAIIYANHGLRSAIRAMEGTFARILSEGSSDSLEANIATLAEVFDLQGDAQIDTIVATTRTRRKKRA